MSTDATADALIGSKETKNIAMHSRQASKGKAALEEAEASIVTTDATADALIGSKETQQVAQSSKKAPKEKKEKKPQKPKAEKAPKAPVDTKGITSKKADDLAEWYQQILSKGSFISYYDGTFLHNTDHILPY
jgi:hypothetical protein